MTAAVAMTATTLRRAPPPTHSVNANASMPVVPGTQLAFEPIDLVLLEPAFGAVGKEGKGVIC
jgi:hypothetical protein